MIACKLFMMREFIIWSEELECTMGYCCCLAIGIELDYYYRGAGVALGLAGEVDFSEG